MATSPAPAGSRADAGCVVGIDGLPRGSSAVVAVDGVEIATIEIVDDTGRPVDLERRVAEAIARGERLAGCPVEEVRLHLLDDGDDGARADQLIDHWAIAGIRCTVLTSDTAHRETAHTDATHRETAHVDAAHTGPAPAGSADDRQPVDSQGSVARARRAALG